MKSMTPEERRKRRLNQLAGKLSNAEVTNKVTGTHSSLTLLLGWGQMEWGARRERVREYLSAMEDAGLITINEKEDSITWVGPE